VRAASGRPLLPVPEVPRVQTPRAREMRARRALARRMAAYDGLTLTRRELDRLASSPRVRAAFDADPSLYDTLGA
jgi:hypothetical protein